MASFKRAALLLVAGLVHCCLIGEGESAQCMPDKTNPCIARCNGTSFDLSKAFNFPVQLSESERRLDGKMYGYAWSPCEPVSCESGSNPTPNSAVCQNGDFTVNCGQYSRPIWLMDSYDSGRFPNWQIEYPWGTTWRISVFNFIVDETVSTPTISFVSETPPLQYNFLVTGRCIGQDTFECQKFYADKQKAQK